MKINLLTFCISLVCLGSCQTNAPAPTTAHPWNPELSAESNIAHNALTLRTNDDFTFLKKIVKDKRIIMLGEQGHGDITTTEVKIKLVKTLQEWGFRTITFEVIPMLSSYAWNSVDYYHLTKSWNIRNLMISPWIQQPTFDPMVEMIRNKKIRLFGMDRHVVPTDLQIARYIIEKYPIPFEFDWTEFERLLSALYKSYCNLTDCPVSEQAAYMEMLSSIQNQLNHITRKYGSAPDVDAVKQWVRIAKSYLLTLTTEVGRCITIGDLMLNVGNSRRDMHMAENVKWYTDRHPDEKIIVWCANLHGAKDISQTTHPADPLLYYQTRLLGENLYQMYGDELYSLAFTSLSSEIPEIFGDLEAAINLQTQNSPYAFIDFESLRFQEGYRNASFDCAVILKKKGRWLNIYDGLYCIRDQVRKQGY